MADTSQTSYTDIKQRLDEIVDAVNDDTMPLDDALALYEEAVKLGLQVSTMIEEESAARVAADEAAAEAAETGDESAQAVDEASDETSRSSDDASPSQA